MAKTGIKRNGSKGYSRLVKCQNLTKKIKTMKEDKKHRALRPDTSSLHGAVNPLTVADFVIYVNKTKIWKKDITGRAAQMVHELESAKITKLYIKSSNRLNIGKMDMKARDLWYWIGFGLDSGQDYIWINYERYMEEWDVSLNTYKSALDELIDSGLLALSKVKGVYWINPRYQFNGSRPRKYPDNVVIINNDTK